jgi:hypothetical protein
MGRRFQAVGQLYSTCKVPPVVSHRVVHRVSEELGKQRADGARRGQYWVLQVRGDAQHGVGLSVRVPFLR